MILVLGSSNMDMVVKTHRFPAPGETILGGEFFMFAGGKGANQAVAAVRLGARVTFITKVGKDIFGNKAIEGYKKEGIQTDHIFVDGNAASGVAMITVNEQGENNIVVAPGANHSISHSDIDHIASVMELADIILLQLEIPIPVVEHAITVAGMKDKKIILNPAPAQKINPGIFRYLFAITPNETEAEILTGIRVTDLSSAERSAKDLIEKGVRNVLITLGAKGVYVYTGEYKGLVNAPVVQAVDTTAAGDVFSAALAVALEKGKSWKDAANFACKAAAISVTKMGAQSSAPYLKEISDCGC